MITVLTLTYQRHHLLEEAIESYLRQSFSGDSEMLIINDCDSVKYVYNDNPNVRIINTTRFSSIWEKLKFGISQAKYEYVYRLDDDDLLSPWAIKNSCEDIIQNPDYDVYRSNGHYFFCHNKFEGISDNVNNGNIYTKKYIENINHVMENVSGNEDSIMTFNFEANIYMSPRTEKTMIYRWGMGTYHISGMGLKTNEEILKKTDSLVIPESGVVYLNPNFKENYFEELNNVK
jgi:hypothetical protein